MAGWGSSASRTVVIASVIAAAFLAQVGAGLSVQSGTCDELGAHLPAGILHWRTGRPTGGLANPPLGQLLTAAGPVLTGTAAHPLRDGPGTLLPARVPAVLLGLLTLAATALLAARAGGVTAGLAAAGAGALCPDVVAHSGLATLDLPVTAFTALAMGLAWRWWEERSTRTLLGFAFAISSAAMIKATALHSLAALTLGALLTPTPVPERARRVLVLVAGASVAIFISAWLLYGPGPSALGLPAPYVQGLGDKLGQGARGHFSYLLGERSTAGFAHYYLVALGVKLPIALQLCAVLGAVWLWRMRTAANVRAFAMFVLLPSIWLVVTMSLAHRVHVGVRHILPAYPALLALGGFGWTWLLRGGRFGRAVAIALAAWCAASVAMVTPDAITYFNEFAGGPDKGDAILIDSNLDWGQSETRFRSWAQGQTIAVNPDFPSDGRVAANVNALHGILQTDDLRLRWLRHLTPVRTIGHVFRVYDVDEPTLRAAAGRDSVAALDYAWWLVGVGRAEEARVVLASLERTGLPNDAVHGRGFWRVRAEAALAQHAFADAAAAAERSGNGDLVAEIDHRRREAQGRRPGAAEAARAIRALSRRGHREEASALGREIFGADPLAPQPADARAAWTDAGRLKALGAERDALETVGRALATDPSNADALWLYGELVVRRKLGLTEYEWPDVDWSRIRRAR